MSDNKNDIKSNDELDDFIDKEEYEKAIAALESSKSIRLKENTDKKRAEAKALRDSKVKAYKTDALKKADKAGIKNPFLRKCITDPIIPLCLIVAFLAVVGVIIYSLVPLLSTPSMGFNIDELRVKYSNSSIYKESLSNYGFQIPDVTYSQVIGQTSTGVSLTADPNALKQVKEANPKYIQYFQGTINNNATSFGTGLLGYCRKSDKDITALRIMAEYSNSDGYYDFILIYFASYFQTIYPDLTSEAAVDLAEAAIANFNNPTYIVQGDYAYKVSLVQDTITYFALDIVPASAIAR